LYYFTAVCEYGSLHAAAEKVYVAQPSLSRQIRRLESDLGFSLFERSSRGLVPTAAGRAFLPVARDLLNRAAHAEATSEAIARGVVPRLDVVSAPTTVADIIAPFIVRAGRKGLLGNVIEANPERVYPRLWAGEADFAVGTRIPPPDSSYRVIGHAYLWAQVPDDHRFADREDISMAELVTEPIIAMTPAHGVRRMFDTAVATAGLTYTAAIETESPSAAQALAAAGRGVCVLSDDARYGLKSVPIRVRDQHLIITLFGVWEPLHYASAQISQTLDDLSEFIAELYPQVSTAFAVPLEDASGETVP
ncbi:MAG: LysR family transcriptional regulator, partial [Rhodoglobus sp.]|nr:LysR family transcriptional regulator [Rhodoglobus sp.]